MLIFAGFSRLSPTFVNIYSPLICCFPKLSFSALNKRSIRLVCGLARKDLRTYFKTQDFCRYKNLGLAMAPKGKSSKSKGKKNVDTKKDTKALNNEKHSEAEDDLSENEPTKTEKEHPVKEQSKGKAKKEEKSSDKEVEEEVPHEKTTAKEHVVSDDNESDEDDSAKSSDKGKSVKKRGRPAADDSSKEPSAKKTKTEAAKGDSKPLLNKTSSDYENIDFNSAAKTKDGKKWNFKISSWNVAGLKAWVKKSGLDFIKHENPDIVCLQETKCSEKKLPPEAELPGYHCYWLSGEKEGYAGIGLMSKEKPIKVDYGIGKEEFDSEGRVITAEFEKFFLVAVYVPNAGQKLKTLPRRMQWDPLFRAHLKKLDEKKPVILCGDMNVAHSEIDLANPKTNTRSAGFTQEERDGFTELLKEGFVDTFRHFYPEQTGAYTFWTYLSNARARNTGWRLDYFILSERLVPSVCDNVIRNSVYGSDHCPITLLINI